MEIQVRARGLPQGDVAELREYLTRRLQFALGRFGPDVQQVTARVADENGPRGGVDKRCHLTVRGPRLGTVVVEERHEDAVAAVDLAAGRAGRAVARALERAREHALPFAAPGLAAT